MNTNMDRYGDYGSSWYFHVIPLFETVERQETSAAILAVCWSTPFGL